ncbi:MAG: hypothetical protein ACREEE_11160 [Dongiaceae bacterium]
MRGFVHGITILLMIVWTVVVLADIAIGFSVPPGTTDAIVAGVTPDQLTQYYSEFRSAFFSAAAQTRAIVWGIPMIAFGIIAAMTQPVGR